MAAAGTRCLKQGGETGQLPTNTVGLCAVTGLTCDVDVLRLVLRREIKGGSRKLVMHEAKPGRKSTVFTQT